ncbi:MAG: MerR family transcriptional regulator [Chitinispirillales bacterium]|jgi:DNA-binding transcriptional MerR regulator|nr:MerR family transcriptional regulator [Chitinispirillales bacterium]
MAEEDLDNCEQGGLIPSGKLYYTISEVCRATNLEPHVLRYWESEFPQLRPKKNRSGKRAYKDRDIEIVCRIKRLLYEEKYTITGAKRKLTEERKETQDAVPVRSSPKPEEPQTLPPPPLEAETQLELFGTVPQSSSSDFICGLRRELEEILKLLK